MKVNEQQAEIYLSYSPIKRVRMLEGTRTLSTLLHEIKDDRKLSILMTAVHIVAVGEEYAFFTALVEQAPNVRDSEINELYDSTNITNESLVPENLIEELRLVLKVGKAEERGFLYDEKKNRYSFNANVFARHFLQRCYIRSTDDGRLFLYNRKGVYEEASEVPLGKLIRSVMHEGRRNSWKSTYEGEIYKALQREAITVEEMNVHRNYLNVENGMLDLDTYNLLEHSPEYLSTVQIPIHYDVKATAPKFLSFLDDITCNDAELVSVHQELIGYWLTAETKAEKAVYYYGSGANGKSVLASIITELIGAQNVSSIPLSKFNDQFGLESIIGKSLNISAENEMGGKALKTDNFKAIVSGDSITINIKYRPAITYRPFCRQVFLVNNLPDSSDVTEGYFRKIIIIPFPRTFKNKERNVNLKGELLRELPGILNWALEGLKRLRKNDYQFSSSKAIESLQEAYYREQNPVQEFFDEYVIIQENSRTKQSDFYNMYIQWLESQGLDDKGSKSRQVFWKYFKIILNNENVTINKKKVKGTIYFDGLKLKEFGKQYPKLNGDIIQF